MKKLVIIGVGGRRKVIADIAARCRYKDIVFLDDSEKIKNCGRYSVAGDSDRITASDVYQF